MQPVRGISGLARFGQRARGSPAAQRSPAGSLSRVHGSRLAGKQSTLTAQFAAGDPLPRWPSSAGLPRLLVVRVICGRAPLTFVEPAQQADLGACCDQQLLGRLPALAQCLELLFRAITIEQSGERGRALTCDGARLHLDFNKLDFAKWTDKSTLVVDEQRLIRAIASRSRQALHEDRVTHALAALQARASVEEYDDWDLCCGHDLIELLKLGLRKLFGTCSTSRVDGLERVLLQSVYHEAEFMQSSLWATLKQWQSEHPSAHLLPATPEQRRANLTGRT